MQQPELSNCPLELIYLLLNCSISSKLYKEIQMFLYLNILIYKLYSKITISLPAYSHMMEKVIDPFWVGSLRSKGLLGLLNAWKYNWPNQKQKVYYTNFLMLCPLINIRCSEREIMLNVYSSSSNIHAVTQIHSRSQAVNKPCKRISKDSLIW